MGVGILYYEYGNPFAANTNQITGTGQPIPAVSSASPIAPPISATSSVQIGVVSGTASSSLPGIATTSIPADTSTTSLIPGKSFRVISSSTNTYVNWRDGWSFVYNDLELAHYTAFFRLNKILLGESRVDLGNLQNASGSKIYTMALSFQIETKETKGEYPACLPLVIRRVIGEAGDAASPLESAWPSDNGGCVSSQSGTYRPTITFEIPSPTGQFLFTSGGSSSTLFFVNISPSGTITTEYATVQGTG